MSSGFNNLRSNSSIVSIVSYESMCSLHIFNGNGKLILTKEGEHAKSLAIESFPISYSLRE